MKNIINEMTQKGWVVWGLVKVCNAPVVFFTNKACKYVGIMIEKSMEKSMEDAGYIFSKNEKIIDKLLSKAKLC